MYFLCCADVSAYMKGGQGFSVQSGWGRIPLMGLHLGFLDLGVSLQGSMGVSNCK